MYNTNYEFIVCRYGELSTKGKNRRNFTAQLVRNVRSQLVAFPNLTYRETYDRLYITLNGEDGLAVSDELRHVFGLSSFSLAVKVERDLDVIANVAAEMIQKEEGKSTFKVIARRHDKSYEHISDVINRHVATKILQTTEFKVDVRKPDVGIIIEVRSDSAYIMMGRVEGAGGYPVGIQGKVMVMLSGGIDSPVAAYLMMKRGVRIEAIHFASPPYTSDEAQKKVMDLAQQLTNYQDHIRINVVPFTDVQLEIYKKVPESYAITMMRRFMLRIAERLAFRRNCLAIANGESLGQVASQTLHSMKEITNIGTLPILRPLITYDKVEIIDLARKIDTYETSILPFEDCCTIFTPKNPTTKPHGDKILRFEEGLDIDALVDEAIKNIEVVEVTKKKQEDTPSFL
ncbi:MULTISPECIES: tRNA uracil 4-sulfurtransferase ThiI [unclassified Erysipelothrix]|uniref:tRNA uracil 4-sulfurtransferase ThiI n=1 Tax=unclassified Erysipelothrix TaxID=2624170 RepID=UPI00137893D4|nr:MULTISPECIES: tRNA uracil 4-sulfurtransferase ThiI [unclassified Erysipelothrix]MBK2401848.1 tRNA 4-thiouridine(8) synthase ThiI [Erysipelothrix sp. strain 2 (EsS2-6-Brazil)]MBK2404012.1 tRNA 4-thiouridine(8) synthase ThiI [Erysipelothrix sp. strain 2 (EsS2-7-Brazil)]NBA00936.1 tRNA 4-thiouridine(8) synthase ThiI [Erysipelothrix rhusiopathiae]